MSLSYPEGINEIPYASFLSIRRYEYSAAMDKAAKDQNDALGAIRRRKNQITGLIDNATKGVEFFTDSGDQRGKSFKGDSDLKDKLESENAKAGSEDVNAPGLSNIGPNASGFNIKDSNGEDVDVNKILEQKKQAINSFKAGLMSETCHLPMPNEFQYSYGAEWSNTFKLGTLALISDNPLKALGGLTLGAVASGSVGAATTALSKNKNVTNFNKNNPDAASNIAEGVTKGIGFASNPFNVNSDINMKNLVGLAGLAPNENAIQMFERMGMREFEFTFELASRNAQESAKITTIIEWFKRGMHPATKNGRGSSVLLQFPDVWVIEPKFIPVEGKTNKTKKAIQHPMMPKTKFCALQNVQVNTTPLSQFQTVFDGSIPLIQLTLKFKETTALTRMDMEGAEKLDNTNPKFRRSPSLDNYPSVTY